MNHTFTCLVPLQGHIKILTGLIPVILILQFKVLEKGQHLLSCLGLAHIAHIATRYMLNKIDRLHRLAHPEHLFDTIRISVQSIYLRSPYLGCGENISKPRSETFQKPRGIKPRSVNICLPCVPGLVIRFLHTYLFTHFT